VVEADRLLQDGHAAEAAPLLEQAASLDDRAPGLAAARAALARARQEGGRTTPSSATIAPSARSPAAAPGLDDREAERLYREGQAALAQGRTDDAVRYFELVWSSRPNYRQVRECLKREYLTRGMGAFAAGQLQEAVTQWERALAVDPQDEHAQGYLARARKQIARGREILGLER
jgi:tetratricopeptide (TPR) repeat protein